MCGSWPRPPIQAFVRRELQTPLGPEEPGLFELALERAATAVVFVESLARPAATAPPPDPELLAEALRAARAPGVSLLVVVTARAGDDVGLDAIRRSGTPYVILSAPAVACLPDACALAGRRVLVPAQGGPRIAALPVTHLLDQLLRAISEEDLQGRTLRLTVPGPVMWVEFLRQLGARPLLARPWRIRIGQWFGQIELGALLGGSQAIAPPQSGRLLPAWRPTVEQSAQRPPCMPAAA